MDADCSLAPVHSVEAAAGWCLVLLSSRHWGELRCSSSLGQARSSNLLAIGGTSGPLLVTWAMTANQAASLQNLRFASRNQGSQSHWPVGPCAPPPRRAIVGLASTAPPKPRPPSQTRAERERASEAGVSGPFFATPDHLPAQGESPKAEALRGLEKGGGGGGGGGRGGGQLWSPRLGPRQKGKGPAGLPAWRA